MSVLDLSDSEGAARLLKKKAEAIPFVSGAMSKKDIWRGDVDELLKSASSEEARVVIRERCKNDLHYLNQHVLRESSALELSPLHEEMAKFISSDAKRKMVLIPRGHLKTTVCTVGRVCQLIMQNPEIRILIVNVKLDNAIGFLRKIKSHFETNEVFKWLNREILPEKNAKWTETEIIVRRRGAFQEATVEVIGVLGSLVSKHYDVIIYDDVVDGDNTATKEQIDKVLRWWRESLSLLEPNGEVQINGTRWNYGDLYGWILEHLKSEYKVYVRRAIENGEPIWKDKFTLEYLEKLRKEQGGYVFACTPAGTKMLMSNWSYKNIEDVKVGDEVIGYTVGSGNIRGRCLPSKVLASGDRLALTQTLFLKSGKKIRCTLDHKWFTGRSGTDGHHVYAEAGFKKSNVKKLVKGFDVYGELPKEYTYEAGWLGGMFDGDGSVSSTLTITQSDNVNPGICDEIRRVFNLLGFSFTEYRHPEKTDVIMFVFGGKRDEAIRFVNWCHPYKSWKIMEYLFERGGFKNEDDPIEKIELNDYEKVYSIQTETGNYIIEGYYSKNCQYLLEPIDSENAVFRKEWIKYYKEEDLREKTLRTYMTIDPAISLTKGSDNSAIVVCSVDEYNNMYVRATKFGRWLPKELIALIFDMNELYHPIRIGLETAAFQKSLKYALQDEMRESGIFLPLQELKFSSVNMRNKEQRVQGLQPRFENGAIWLKDGMDDLEDELLRFPAGKHDDIVDALAYQLQLISVPRSDSSRGARRRRTSGWQVMNPMTGY